jgi:hypothetical protein
MKHDFVGHQHYGQAVQPIGRGGMDKAKQSIGGLMGQISTAALERRMTGEPTEITPIKALVERASHLVSCAHDEIGYLESRLSDVTLQFPKPGGTEVVGKDSLPRSTMEDCLELICSRLETLNCRVRDLRDSVRL